MQAGDVLVCRMTNPAWVVLFTKIARPRHRRRRRGRAPGRRGARVRAPGRRRHVDRDAADQDRRPRPRQRRDGHRRDPRVSVVRGPSCATRSRTCCSSASSRGDYQPGERLVETAHRARARHQPGPVREALRDLEQLGLVVHEPYRGCSVRRGLAGASCARPSRCGPRSRRSPRAWPHRASTTPTSPPRRAARGDGGGRARRRPARPVARQRRASTRTIVAAAGNATLERQWSLLEPFARTYLTVQRSRGRSGARSPSATGPIVAALRARDGAAAAAAMQTHLEEAERLLAHPATTATEEHAA